MVISRLLARWAPGVTREVGSVRCLAFRESWAREFSATFGTGVVAPRVLTETTAGAGIVETRNALGIRIAHLKDDVHEVEPLGVQPDQT